MEYYPLEYTIYYIYIYTLLYLWNILAITILSMLMSIS